VEGASANADDNYRVSIFLLIYQTTSAGGWHELSPTYIFRRVYQDPTEALKLGCVFTPGASGEDGVEYYPARVVASHGPHSTHMFQQRLGYPWLQRLFRMATTTMHVNAMDTSSGFWTTSLASTV